MYIKIIIKGNNMKTYIFVDVRDDTNFLCYKNGRYSMSKVDVANIKSYKMIRYANHKCDELNKTRIEGTYYKYQRPILKVVKAKLSITII